MGFQCSQYGRLPDSGEGRDVSRSELAVRAKGCSPGALPLVLVLEELMVEGASCVFLCLTFSSSSSA